MLHPLLVLASLQFAATAAATLEERIDVYDTETGAFLGSEVTNYAPDGRRLRLVTTDAGVACSGVITLVRDLCDLVPGERGLRGDATVTPHPTPPFEVVEHTAKAPTHGLARRGDLQPVDLVPEDGRPRHTA